MKHWKQILAGILIGLLLSGLLRLALLPKADSPLVIVTLTPAPTIARTVSFEDPQRSNSIDLSGLININTATQEQLEELPGIGAVKAKAIIEYRNDNGDFFSIEELLNVAGIGQSIFDNLKALITVAP